MANWSIRTRLFLLIALALLPVALLLALSAKGGRDQEARRALRDSALLRDLAVASYADQLQSASDLLQVLAIQPELRTDPLPECGARLAAAARIKPYISNIGVIAKDGDVLCSELPFTRPLNVADRDYFQQALATRSAVIAAPVVSRVSGLPVFPIVVPVFSPDGREVIRVLYAAVNLQQVAAVAQALALPPGASLSLIDGQGVVIDHYPEPAKFAGVSVRETPLFRAITAQDQGTTEETGVDGTPRVYAFSRLSGAPLHLQLGLSAAEVFADADSAMRGSVILSILVVGLVFGALTIGTRRLVAEPYAALAATTRRLAEGDYQVRTGLSQSRSEIGLLAAAIDRMAANLGLQAKEREEAARVRESLAAAQAARTAAEREQSRVQALLDASPDAMVVIDHGGTVVGLNRQAETCFGYGKEELLGHSIELLIPEPLGQAAREYLKASAPRPPLQQVEGRRKDGSAFPLELNLSRVQLAEGMMVIASVRDVTERQAAAERLLEAQGKAQAAAEQANQAKSEFLSRISHELRTPLNAVLGFAQLLEMDGLSGNQRNSVDQIMRAGQRLLQLVNEVLDISRIETGHLELSLEPVAVGGILEEALALVRPLAAQAGLLMTLDAPTSGDETRYVLADRHRLHQVLLNLLINAVKYNRPGGAITLSYTALPGDTVRIEVADTGLGIPAHRMPELFEPFNRLGAERTGVEGSGIGLAVTQRLVEAMGGTIGARSTFGEGSTFWVDLPQTTAPEPRAEGVPSAAPQTVQLPPLQLLYVEDNLSNLNLIARLVERWPQVRLLTAMQGRIGLELARQHRPDLILLDLHLPDLWGDEVLADLKRDERTREIPVVLLSADASPNRIQRLLAQGARSYLTKPLDLRELIKLIDDVVREQHG